VRRFKDLILNNQQIMQNYNHEHFTPSETPVSYFKRLIGFGKGCISLQSLKSLCKYHNITLIIQKDLSKVKRMVKIKKFMEQLEQEKKQQLLEL
jgi:hypothetical protein